MKSDPERGTKHHFNPALHLASFYTTTVTVSAARVIAV
jgi:hypothetical protein